MCQLAREKKQDLVGDIGHAAEEPEKDNHRGDRRQQNRQTGEEIRAPLGKKVLIHGGNVGRRKC